MELWQTLEVVHLPKHKCLVQFKMHHLQNPKADISFENERWMCPITKVKHKVHFLPCYILLYKYIYSIFPAINLS